MSKENQKLPAKFFRRVFKLLSIIFFVLLGGLLFNLDRLDTFGYKLLEYKQLLPEPVRKLLPGERLPEGAATPREELRGRIIAVYDGDTATLISGQQKYKLRFYGIDAPERAQRGGKASREALAAKILGQDVTVCVVNCDHYGRSVARIFIGERDINLEMIREGHAWHYAGYAKNEDSYRDAEKYARERKLGLWSNADPQPPWEYRKSRRK